MSSSFCSRNVFPLYLLIAMLAAAFALPTPAEASDTDRASLDPLVADVVRMLDAGVKAELVEEWIESQGRRPAAVGADDLIALSRAGAPDELSRRLLELADGARKESGSAGDSPSREPAAPRPDSPASDIPRSGTPRSGAPRLGVPKLGVPTPGSEEPGSTPTQEPAPPPVQVPSPAPSHSRPEASKSAEAPVSALPKSRTERPTLALPATPQAPRLTPVDGDGLEGRAAVRFRFRYRPLSDEDEEAWDLYAYLDGEVLAWIPAGGNPFAGNKNVFVLSLPPGRHEIRLIQQRHEKRRGGWRHSSRVAPEVLAFELTPGTGWELAVEVVQHRFRPAGRDLGLSWNLSRQGQVTESGNSQTASPETWPALCEDIEAGVEPGKKPPRHLRGALVRCRRWGSLWTIVEPPTRQAVLGDLEAYDFRPIPVTSE